MRVCMCSEQCDPGQSPHAHTAVTMHGPSVNIGDGVRALTFFIRKDVYGPPILSGKIVL